MVEVGDVEEGLLECDVGGGVNLLALGCLPVEEGPDRRVLLPIASDEVVIGNSKNASDRALDEEVELGGRGRGQGSRRGRALARWRIRGDDGGEGPELLGRLSAPQGNGTISMSDEEAADTDEEDAGRGREVA